MTAISQKRPKQKMDAKTRRRKIGHVLGRIIFYLVCACLAYQLLYPVLYMSSMAIRDPGDINDPSIVWIPKHFTLENFSDALKSMSYWKAFGVSMTLSIVCGFFDVFSCAIAGYGFARFKFPGKNILFLIVVFTIVVPSQTLILPLYSRWRYASFGGLAQLFTGKESINLIGTLWPMILPSMLALGTGSVTKIGDTYHAFYTGNNPRFFQQGKPREYIRHAVSQDGVHFTKLEEETFTSSPADGYSTEDFRDPFLFYNEEQGEYWLLITSVLKGKAAVARYASTDLSTWELREPLLLPGTTSCECPDLFKWGDWWYCFYSTDWVTRYMRASSLDGPWEHPPMEAFDSHAFYAAKTGVLNGKRYLCGWIATRGGYSGEFKDTSAWDWAGNLAVFELEQDENGWLSIHLPDTIQAAFGDPMPLNGKLVSAEGSAEGDKATLSADRDGGAVIFDALPDQPVLISADVTISENALAAGFSFGGANLARALAVSLDMKYGLLRYDATAVARTRYSIESSHISRKIDTERRIYHLDVLIDNDVAVFFLDHREALSTRIYRMPGMPWGIFVCDGEACFENLTMRLLKEE